MTNISWPRIHKGSPLIMSSIKKLTRELIYPRGKTQLCNLPRPNPVAEVIVSTRKLVRNDT